MQISEQLFGIATGFFPLSQHGLFVCGRIARSFREPTALCLFFFLLGTLRAAIGCIGARWRIRRPDSRLPGENVGIGFERLFGERLQYAHFYPGVAERLFAPAADEAIGLAYGENDALHAAVDNQCGAGPRLRTTGRTRLHGAVYRSPFERRARLFGLEDRLLLGMVVGGRLAAVAVNTCPSRVTSTAPTE